MWAKYKGEERFLSLPTKNSDINPESLSKQTTSKPQMLFHFRPSTAGSPSSPVRFLSSK